jgi:hypothetical protein
MRCDTTRGGVQKWRTGAVNVVRREDAHFNGVLQGNIHNSERNGGHLNLHITRPKHISEGAQRHVVLPAHHSSDEPTFPTETFSDLSFGLFSCVHRSRNGLGDSHHRVFPSVLALSFGGGKVAIKPLDSHRGLSRVRSHAIDAGNVDDCCSVNRV